MQRRLDTTAMVWLRALGLTLPIASMCGVENTRGKGKIEIYTCYTKLTFVCDVRPSVRAGGHRKST